MKKILTLSAAIIFSVNVFSQAPNWLWAMGTGHWNIDDQGHSVTVDGAGNIYTVGLLPGTTAVDFDPVFIEDAISRINPNWPMTCKVHDMLKGPVEGDFDALYSLDVLEHIEPKDEDSFLKNITDSLIQGGVAIIGMPSLESQSYASPQSKEGHVNCKTGNVLKSTLEKYFDNVFIFSMNDEVIHTGYFPMAHYLMALCVGPKK